MEKNNYIKKSTFIITIFILLLIFIASIIFIISYYKNRNITVNIPTVVENENVTDNIIFNVLLIENN